MSTHKTLEQFFSNLTWGVKDPDYATQVILKDWTTSHTNFYFHLAFYSLMIVSHNSYAQCLHFKINISFKGWTSALASTIPVPSGTFTPVFKTGAAIGRLVGEIMALLCPDGIPFGGRNIPIVPGGYAVVGAAAFGGAVTHSISTSVMVFELTGQMSHILPVIMAVLIANAVTQNLKPSIYDSIIEIKKLPFLPPIMSTSSIGHNILVDDIMIKDIVYVWRNCTYKNIKNVLNTYPKIESFPLVDSPSTMILLGSIQRLELKNILHKQMCRERRLEEVQRRYLHQDTVRFLTYPSKSEFSSSSVKSYIGSDRPRRPSPFEVTLINGQQDHLTGQSKNLSPPPSPTLSSRAPKSILKPSLSVTYSPYSTLSHGIYETQKGTFKYHFLILQILDYVKHLKIYF